MLEKRTILDRFELDLTTGDIAVRAQKQIVDGDVIAMAEPHRSVIPSGQPADPQMDAIDTHLVAMGYPAIPKEHRAILSRLVDEFRK